MTAVHFIVGFVIGSLIGHFAMRLYLVYLAKRQKKQAALNRRLVDALEWKVAAALGRPLPVMSGSVVNGQLVPVGATVICTLDSVTEQEGVWCLYPIETIDEAIRNLNELYGGQKLFWKNGDVRPDVLARAQQEDAAQRERARYITRPLERRGVPIYRNNSRSLEIIAYAPTHEAALELQQKLMRERGISTSVPGEGV